ncbi:hypothetical protein O181_002860 [Austropuccinia psidii MF-1]|uniref:DUF4939 domain-containing protein n=1 Tax=Austropuccinia psidii MF-1 TaxID=1389203 RepID=A0A9Q3BDA0_9BASI|nr:hypothetical protein [Austropuccinia psidii MF-1]
MKAHDPFDGTQAHKFRGFIQSCELIFHNDPENLFSDRKKVLYSTSFLTGGAGKWIEQNLSIRKAEKELDNLRMKESGHLSFYISDLIGLSIDSPKGEDLISGYDFLYHLNTIIHWKNGFITNDASYKDSSGINPFTINDFAISDSSVSLFGELNTTSLPSSLHIPFIMPSQSLLPSRDEVFKEIEDVGEDFSISSLHLFQGDMDLPPLSFHEYLEEQWDDAEE